MTHKHEIKFPQTCAVIALCEKSGNADNKGLKEMAGEVANQIFLLLNRHSFKPQNVII